MDTVRRFFRGRRNKHAIYQYRGEDAVATEWEVSESPEWMPADGMGETRKRGPAIIIISIIMCLVFWSLSVMIALSDDQDDDVSPWVPATICFALGAASLFPMVRQVKFNIEHENYSTAQIERGIYESDWTPLNEDDE